MHSDGAGTAVPWPRAARLQSVPSKAGSGSGDSARVYVWPEFSAFSSGCQPPPGFIPGAGSFLLATEKNQALGPMELVLESAAFLLSHPVCVSPDQSLSVFPKLWGPTAYLEPYF